MLPNKEMRREQDRVEFRMRLVQGSIASSRPKSQERRLNSPAALFLVKPARTFPSSNTASDVVKNVGAKGRERVTRDGRTLEASPLAGGKGRERIFHAAIVTGLLTWFTHTIEVWLRHP